MEAQGYKEWLRLEAALKRLKEIEREIGVGQNSRWTNDPEYLLTKKEYEEAEREYLAAV